MEDCLDGVLQGYRRKPYADGASPFQILFGVPPRFPNEPPMVEEVGKDAALMRELRFATIKAIRANA